MCVRLRVESAENALGVMRAFVAKLRVVEVTCSVWRVACGMWRVTCDACEQCTISLGGCHTTLCLPCETSHAALSEEERRGLGLGADCFRCLI
jgi:hypothetical protein